MAPRAAIGQLLTLALAKFLPGSGLRSTSLASGVLSGAAGRVLES